MREAQLTQARNWHASLGSSRHFPVRHEPVVSANTQARGGTLSPPRVRLRNGPLHTRMYMLAGIVLFVFLAVQAAPAAAPADPWTGLQSGRIGDYLWEVKTKRKEGSGAAGLEQPCLLVGTSWEVSPFDYRRSRYRACAGAEGHLTAADPPLVATGVQPSSGKSVDMTAVGMILAPAARKVRITLSDGRQQTIPLHMFSHHQARSARLSRFEYAAFATRGLWCAERMISLSGTGKVLWDSGTDGFACGAGDSGGPSFE
jgi:hypothetical protein